jgi:hypothetical protein
LAEAKSDHKIPRENRKGEGRHLQWQNLNKQTNKQTNKQNVATILDHNVDATIHDWLELVQQSEELAAVPLNQQDRTGHLPKLLQEVVARLRLGDPSKASISIAAGLHGELRSEQGYTVPMLVDESRILQVSIFGTLKKNVDSIDASELLTDVITVADEADSQLKQTTIRYMEAEALKRSQSDSKGRS